MMDMSQQIAYWRDNACEDLEVANQLVTARKSRHGLFFAHLALEKILKAHVCKAAGKAPPRIHNLVRLAELSSTNMPESYLMLLSELNAFNLEGRYPVPFIADVSPKEADDYMTRTREVFEWLDSRLSTA